MSHRVGLGAIDHGDPFVHLRHATVNDRGRPSTSSGTRRIRRLSSRLVFALMLLTSMLAVLDLYLLASSALH